LNENDDWSNWTDADLEKRLFDAQPGSENHEKAKYLLEKRRHEKEMTHNSVAATSPSVEPREGIRILTQLLLQGQSIQSRHPINTNDTFRWGRTVRAMLVECFGSPTENISDFEEASFGGGTTATEANDQWDRISASVLERQLALLQSSVEQLNYKYEASSSSKSSQAVVKSGTGVFLVHGHDGGLRETVARFLEKLDLSVTILHEKPDKGRTLIEKFSDYSDVGFAVVLLTADDRGGQKDAPYEKQSYRARQNVLLELGFFLGKLGRPNVCTLYEAGVELPSDYAGVLFVPIDKADAWRLSLAREIKESGIPVDLNKAL
jgi:predicted nucleotide-binding protein